MGSPREGSPSRLKTSLRKALWAGLSVGWILPSVGCQVEYAGMTLPSGKYMYDDVQYFPPGPSFPWAETQAATQRARMQAQGIDVGVEPTAGPAVPPPPAPGGLAPGQNAPGRAADVNAGGVPPVPAPGPAGNAPAPAPGAVAEPAGVPAPG
jgi:hypothetical protein